MAVIKQIERDYPDALYHDGLDVVTTLDLDWQQAAQRLAQLHLDEINHPTTPGKVPANATDAALVAMDPYTGQVLTMLGSPDYFDESIDGNVNAALALRQPGSALKPFTYSAALDPNQPDPWTAGTVLLDVSTPFITRKLQSYTPANFGLVEHGPVTIREALASSFNIPAVITLDHVGIQAMVTLANNAGLTSLAQNTAVDLAITLGGGEVRLLDMAQAYSIFPNGGYRVEPTFLLKVTDRKQNQVLYQWQPTPLGSTAQTTRLIDPRVAYLISNILSDNQARLRGFGLNSALNIGRPAAAKTGTTTDFRDNWVMGFTPNLVVGVWVGNADNTPMVDVTGVSGAAPIWNAFMREVLNGQPELDFTEPPGIVTRSICTMSGLLATPECPRQRVELYIDGTQPTQPDNVYQTFTIDRLTGQLADNSTPPDRRVDKVFAVLPQEARDWGLAQRNPAAAGRRGGSGDRQHRRSAPARARSVHHLPDFAADARRHPAAPLDGGRAAGHPVRDLPARRSDPRHGGRIAVGTVVDAPARRSRPDGDGSLGGRHDADQRRRPVQRHHLRAAAESR